MEQAAMGKVEALSLAAQADLLTIERLVKDANKAMPWEVRTVPQEPSDVYFLRMADGTFERKVAEPRPANPTFGNIEDMVAFLSTGRLAEGIIFDEDEIRGLWRDGGRQRYCRVALDRHKEFMAVSKADNRTFTHAQFDEWLTGEMGEANGYWSEEWLCKKRHERTSWLRVCFAPVVFDVDGVREHRSYTRANILVDTSQDSVRVIFIGDALGDALRDALAEVRRRIVAALEQHGAADRIKVYHAYCGV